MSIHVLLGQSTGNKVSIASRAKRARRRGRQDGVRRFRASSVTKSSSHYCICRQMLSPLAQALIKRTCFVKHEARIFQGANFPTANVTVKLDGRGKHKGRKANARRVPSRQVLRELTGIVEH